MSSSNVQPEPMIPRSSYSDFAIPAAEEGSRPRALERVANTAVNVPGGERLVHDVRAQPDISARGEYGRALVYGNVCESYRCV